MDSASHDPSALCPGGSVGAWIEKDGTCLMLYRTASNSGIAGIAGHLDPGETPEQALIREVREEAGIEVEEYDLRLHETFPNPCRRGFGAHEWWVFTVTKWRGEPRLMEPDKHRFVRFLSKTEIQDYLDREDADPAWQSFILPAIAF